MQGNRELFFKKVSETKKANKKNLHKIMNKYLIFATDEMDMKQVWKYHLNSNIGSDDNVIVNV